EEPIARLVLRCETVRPAAAAASARCQYATVWEQRTAGNRAVPLVIRALSFPQAAALFRSRLQPLAESDPEVLINLSEVNLTCSFVAEVTATFKAVRHFLRVNPAVQQQGCPYPQYSPDFERMIAFVQRLRGRLATSR